MPPFYARKDWLLEDPDRTEADVVRVLQVMSKRPLPEKENLFLSRAAIAHVFTSNKMEGTLPSDVNEYETFRLLECTFNAGPAAALKDGDFSKLQVQMSQHMEAFLLAWSLEGPLTVGDIQRIHGVMMRGSPGIEAGVFRRGAAYGNRGAYNQYVYPEPASIPELVDRALARFNEAKPEDLHQAIQHATRFFLDLITAHPFADGNGRLCRLLLAVALKRGKVPFPISLSTGHSKARTHYARAIFMAQDAFNDVSIEENLGQLRAIVLMSVHAKIANYVKHSGLAV
ncbi:hypothetical protein BASA81_002069 [Batrachochytrium salamandrivorans]|nr:hypothetical protein BASA81_002069 [Batrachochytrium salamandrivorans]